MPWPYGNVYDYGDVCWGSVPKESVSLADPWAVERLFFDSEFNGDLWRGPTDYEWDSFDEWLSDHDLQEGCWGVYDSTLSAVVSNQFGGSNGTAPETEGETDDDDNDDNGGELL
jgi:hypothetical protein